MTPLRGLLAACGLLLAGHAGAVDDAALAQCAAVSDDRARLACYDALAQAPAPAAAAAATAPASPPAPGDFGLPKPPTAAEKELAARIDGPFTSWKPGQRFTLDNGQVWKVVGEDSGYYPNVPDHAEVVIKQTLFGGYRMEIVAIGRRVKVKRVR